MKPVRLIKPAAILLVSAAVCLLGRVLFKAFFPDPRESAMAAAVIPGADVLLTFQPGRMAEEGFFDRFAPSPAHYRQAFGRARSGAGWQAAAGSLDRKSVV